MSVKKAGPYLFPMTAPTVFGSCKDRLTGIIISFEDWCMGTAHFSFEKQISENDRACSMFKSRFQLLDKWSLHFLSLLTLEAGEQRPRVYWQLQSPGRDDLADFERNASQRSFCSLKTIQGKTLRSLNIPNVIIPSHVFSFLRFHTDSVQAIILEIHPDNGMNDGFSPPLGLQTCTVEHFDEDRFRTRLLLHSRTGTMLTTHQTTSSFKRFIVDYDASLANVRSMTLRVSFATAMFRVFKSGQLFKEKSQSSFFEHISAVMNTLVEQMRSTYIAIDSLGFQSSAKCVMKAMENVLCQASDDHVINVHDNLLNDSDISEDNATQRRPQRLLSGNYEFLNM